MQREATPSKAKQCKLKQRVSKQSKATQSNVKQSKAPIGDLPVRRSCGQITKDTFSGICPPEPPAERNLPNSSRNVIYPTPDVFSGIRPLGTLADISSKGLYRASVRKTLLRKGHQRYFLWDLSARASCGQMINLMHSIAKQGKVKQR